MEGKELKPKSFRIDDQTAEKFKEIAGKIGGNQQETLAKLIEAYEFQSGKVVLTEKKDEILQFEKYVTLITRMFMGSLEDNLHITETVRSEFEALLNSKDVTIQDLQERLTAEKQLREGADTRAKAHADENMGLKDSLEKLQSEYSSKMDSMQSMLADKDNLNKALTDSCNELKKRAESMKGEVEQTAAIRKERDELRAAYEKMAGEKAGLEKQILQNRQEYEKTVVDLKAHEVETVENLRVQSQLELDKALLELEKSYQIQIQELKADRQTEIDAYQKRYLELLEQMKGERA